MKGISVLLLVAVGAARAQVEECPADQETNWEIEMLLRHEDCNKFYKCTYGQPIEYTCYDGLYFNLETWQCDWPYNVDCEGRNDPALTTLAPTTAEPAIISTTSTTVAPTTTTLAPTSSTTTTTTTPAPTTSTTTTTTTPAPTTSTTTSTTTTSTTTTPAPTSSSSTDYAPECEIEMDPPTSGPQPQPEEEDQELEFLPNGCPVDPHVHWLLPNAEDCNLFYYCVWGELVLRECPATLHFNPVLQVCDWPGDAGCTVSVNKHAEARRLLLKQILS